MRIGKLGVIAALCALLPAYAQALLNPFPSFCRNVIRMDGEVIAADDPDFSAVLGDYRIFLSNGTKGAKKSAQIQRAIIPLRPDWYLLFDELKTSQPMRWEWILSCAEKPEVEAEKERILLRHAKSQLEILFVAPQTLRMVSAEIPKGWSVAVSPAEASDSEQLIALLRPSSDRTKPLDIRRISGAGWIGAKVIGERTYLGIMRTDGGGSVPISAGRLGGDGKAMAASFSSESSGYASYLVVSGRVVNIDSKLVYNSDHPTTSVVRAYGRKLELTTTLNRPEAIWLRTPKKPTAISSTLKKSVKWRYDPVGYLTALYLPAGSVRVVVGW